MKEWRNVTMKGDKVEKMKEWKKEKCVREKSR